MGSDYFVLEKRTGSGSFAELARIAAAVNSNDIKSYSFTDNRVLEGVSYYRLKMVDQDGSFKYSETITIKITRGKLVLMTPNPVRDLIHITTVEPFSGIEIFDTQGKLVKQLAWNSNGWYDLRTLTKGIYVLRLQMKGQVQTQQNTGRNRQDAPSDSH